MNRVRSGLAGPGVFGLAVMAALAFGAHQAAAAPVASAGAVRACSNTQCNALCQRIGGDYGYCYGGYDCVCYGAGGGGVAR